MAINGRLDRFANYRRTLSFALCLSMSRTENGSNGSDKMPALMHATYPAACGKMPSRQSGANEGFGEKRCNNTSSNVL
jgi:hypothetical protein